MKIRTRITLWASLAGLVSTAVLSVIVFLWGLETPYEFLDQELEIRAQTMANEMGREQAAGELHLEILELFSRLYWTKVYDANGRLLFASELARRINLPKKMWDQGYLIPTDIPLNQFYAEEDDQPAGFWNRVFIVPVDGAIYQVHVARPVENLVGESIESVLVIGAALLVSTLILIGVSYLVAGKILHPIREINRLTREITARTLEKRIPLTNNHDEIDQLIASLNAMFNRLQHSFRRQKEFIANAAHELKTPVTLLRLSVEETLQHEHLPAPIQEKLLAQERALARIGLLIKNLLDLSRLELRDELARELFSLTELFFSVTQEFDALLYEQDIRLVCCFDGVHLFAGDREKMRRVAINLLDNAVRYNHRGGEIRCLLATGDSGETIMTVANTGPFIDQTDLDRIFDQFYRCEKSRSAAHGGVGLGLTIVKRIVALHGGRIAVESGEDGWNAFRLLFFPRRS
ncbi:ATP-binding protein [Desulfobulbus sp.]|uniref:sensor histidine kinase n=1 Tax=Desulfobulbus sp. TaxID=895 RepID=UPI00286F6BAD|nr:ATP-binding protein [Desulfobulbus sp.]